MKNFYIKLFLLTISLLGAGIGYAANEDLRFDAALTGAQEVTTPSGGPSVGVPTDTSAVIEVQIDRGLTQAQFRINVANGTGLTEAHLHCAPAGVNGPIVAFLFGPANPGVDVNEDSHEGVLDNSKIIVPTDIEACDVPVNNIASLASAMIAGKIYANIHSTAFPNGVARGQIFPRLENGGGNDLNGNGSGLF